MARDQPRERPALGLVEAAGPLGPMSQGQPWAVVGSPVGFSLIGRLRKAKQRMHGEPRTGKQNPHPRARPRYVTLSKSHQLPEPVAPVCETEMIVSPQRHVVSLPGGTACGNTSEQKRRSLHVGCSYPVPPRTPYVSW